VQYWLAVVKNRITASQNWQAKKAAEEGYEYTPNGEMSNKQYSTIAALALACKPFEQRGVNIPTPIGELEPVVISANTGKIAQAERQCFNARIQGGAASLTKLAMINIDRDPLLNELDAHLIITVHDEVLVECPAYYADQVEQRLPQIMIDTAKPYINVPMKCDPYNVYRWYADEAAVAVREEFKKYEEGNPKKNIPPMSREDAIKKLIDNHTELPVQTIMDCIEKGCDLEFD
jgi:hypothetical protein